MLRLGDQPQAVIAAEGITLQQLQDMMSRAAITGLRGANRRYHNWFFEYDQDNERLDRMFQHLPAMNGMEFETCDECGGYGCKDCLWSGEIVI